MKNCIIRCLLALSICSFNSCCSKMERATQTQPTLSENFEILINDSNSNILEEKSMIIDNEEKLKEFYEILNATRSPGFKIPKVDFNTQSVIVVAMGQQNTGGYSISSPSYNLKQGVYEFYFSRPLTNTPVTMSMTTPGIVVVANQPASEISIKVTQRSTKYGDHF